MPVERRQLDGLAAGMVVQSLMPLLCGVIDEAEHERFLVREVIHQSRLRQARGLSDGLERDGDSLDGVIALSQRLRSLQNARTCVIDHAFTLPSGW